MTDRNIELSRRQALAALGTVGAASASAGLGTSAYFTDEESFENNSLAAGELDLRVGWEEHYSDWSDDEADGIASIEMVGENETANQSRVGLPLDADTPENGTLITVENVSQARRFLNNTEPDTNATYSNVTGSFDPETLPADRACEYLQSGADQSPVIIDLDDVKPGDFGEVTFSLALCDNPGYLWMTGGLESADENGVTEPEGKSSKEQSGTVELLDEVRAAAWYDDGDNLQSGGTEQSGSRQADIAFVLDRSGSMSDERNFLEQNINNVASQIANSGIDAQFALVPYEDGDDSCDTFIATDLTADATQLDFSYGTCGGTENASEAILEALDGLSWRPGSQKILVVLTDEDDDGDASTRTQALNRIDSEGACLLAVSGGGSQPNDLQQMSTQVNCGDWVQIDNGLSQSNIEDLIGFVGSVTGGEEVFLKGTLREVLAELAADPSADDFGVCLDGDTSTPFDEVNGDPTAEAREAFAEGTRHDIGFAWWLPASVGNHVQTDTASFSLGFYTEQERHNAGGGTTSS